MASRQDDARPTMTFLPIAERELRMATRARATHWTRVVAGLAALSLTVWMVLTVGRMVPPEQLGANLFRTLTTMALFGCLIPGVLLTADCLSEEKRQGTLGLLFLTDLKGYDIVWGKLIVTSLYAFYGLLAIFPALAIPFFLGGVTAGEFGRMTLLLVNTLFASLAIGMVVSAISWREQRAMIATGLVMVIVTFGLPVLGSAGRLFSPFTGFQAAFDVNYRTSAGEFIRSQLVLQAVSWCCLWLAGPLVRKCWRDDGLMGMRRQARVAAKLGLSAGPVRCRVVDPIAWLARRDERLGWIWFSLALPMVSGMLRQTFFGTAGMNPYLVIVWMICLHQVLQFWIAWESARRLNGDRRSGGLEMLLSTALSSDEIVRCNMASLRATFAGPLVAVLGADVMLVALAAPSLSSRGDAVVELATIVAALMILLVVNAAALGWCGLWLGLKVRKASQATLVSLLRIVLVPTILFLVATFFLVVAGTMRDAGFLAALAVIWLVMGSAVSCIFLQEARLKLHGSFRQVASQTDDPPLIEALPDPAAELAEDFSLLRPAKGSQVG